MCSSIQILIRRILCSRSCALFARSYVLPNTIRPFERFRYFVCPLLSLSLLFWVRHSHTNSVGVCCLCPHPKNLVRDDDDDEEEEDENVVVVVVFVLSLARASDRDKKSATPPPPKKRELSCVASNYSRTSLRPRHHHRHRKSTEIKWLTSQS